MLTMPRLLLFARRPLLLARAASSSPTAIQEVASIALAHGIEMPIGTAPIFAGGGRGLGLGAPTSPSPVAIAARVPLSLVLSCDSGLIARGACGPPPFLKDERLRRLLPEGGCCDDDDDGVAWELRLAALQLLACCSAGAASVGDGGGALPERCRSLWSAWRACGALPAKPPSLLCWSDRELAALGDGALAASAAAWRREARGVYDEFGVAVLCGGGDDGDEGRFAEYLWAVSAVASRAFALVEEEGEIEGGAEGDEEGGSGGGGGPRASPSSSPPRPGRVVGRAAVPLIDLANHGPSSYPLNGPGAANCRVRLVQGGGAGGGGGGGGGDDAFVELVRERGCSEEEEEGAEEEKQEEELLISYGPEKPSRVLMERYGFFPPGGTPSDRIDWRELVVAAAGRGPPSSSLAAAPGAHPAPAPLAREELRRAVLAAGGLGGAAEDGGAALAPPPPLSRAALAAAEAKVVASLPPQSPFGPAHVARAAGSVSRLFGWRNADEFRRARGPAADARARRVGGALARSAARRRAAIVDAAAGVGGEGDPERLALAVAYRAERARMLLALEALGFAMAEEGCGGAT